MPSNMSESTENLIGDHQGKNVFSNAKQITEEEHQYNIEVVLTSKSSKSVIPSIILHEDANNPQKITSKSFLQRFKGIIAILVATGLQAINPQVLYHVRQNLKAPYSNSNYLVWAYFFYSVQNFIPLPFVIYSNPDILLPLANRKSLLLLTLRGLGGSMILFVGWFSLEYFGRPAPVAVITAIAPIVVYINAFFVLGEKLGVIPFVNAFLAIGGVITMNYRGLTSTSKEHTDAWTGTALALTTMYILSWIIVLVRLLREVHPIIVNLSLGVLGMIVHCIISLSISGTILTIKEPTILLLCICTATISTVGNYLFNLALKHEQAGIVSLIRTTEVIFSFVYQYYLFGIDPQMETTIGGSLIIAGVICVTMRKIVSESSEESKLRKYFSILLY